jgi:hypothetical protein
MLTRIASDPSGLMALRAKLEPGPIDFSAVGERQENRSAICVYLVQRRGNEQKRGEASCRLSRVDG